MAHEGKRRKPDTTGFRIWPGVTLIAVCGFLVFFAVYIIAYRAGLIPLPDYVEAPIKKGDFIGRKILMEQKDNTEKRIVPIALVDRGVMRAGMDIYSGDQHVGWVTSGTMVPYYVFEGDEPTDKTGKRSIGFAYIDRNITDGITIDVRGKRLKAKIVEKHMDQTGPLYGKAVL